MQAISNFCTALSAQTLNASADKIVKIEKNADNTTMAINKISVANLHKATKELFSGEHEEFEYFFLLLSRGELQVFY